MKHSFLNNLIIVAPLIALPLGFAGAQQLPEGIEYYPGTGSDNAFYLEQELTTDGATANVTSFEQDGNFNILGDTNPLGLFASGFAGADVGGQAALQYGVNNEFIGSQFGDSNVVSFLQGVSAAEAVNFQATMDEIGAYGVVAANAYGDDVDHSALAIADDLATRLNSWIAAGITSDSSSADVVQDGDANTVMLYQLGDSLVANINQVGSDNEAWAMMATHDSSVDIDQINGDGNQAVVTQLTDGVGGLIADATIMQDGYDNVASITQAASLGTLSLSATIDQSGDFNVASIYQAGQSDANDRADITQAGNNNTAMMSIYGLGNSGEINQYANGTFADLQFTGNDNAVKLTQQEDNAYAAMAINGDDNSITIKQVANTTPIVLDIAGSNNNMKITQR